MLHIYVLVPSTYTCITSVEEKVLEGVRRAAEEVGSSLKDGGWGLACVVCVVGVSDLCGGRVRSVWWACQVCVVGMSGLCGGCVRSVWWVCQVCVW